MKFLALYATLISLASFASAQETILDLLVAQNSSHTGPKVATILSLASPFKAVTDILGGSSPITAFIPTDEAIATALASLSSAPSEADVLNILTYHVVPGVVFNPEGVDDGTFVVKTALSAPTLGDDATQNLIVSLKAPDVTLRFGLGTANVIGSVEASNGIIHYIDALLLPPPSVSSVATAANLTSLLDAVTATKLQSAIEEAKNITIFAPTNAAFAAIADTVSALSTAEIAAVLQYHVVPGAFFSTDVVQLPNNTDITTLLGQKFKISFSDGAPEIIGAGNKSPVKLVITDVLVANGVVHVIDAVLIPDLSAVPTASPSASGGAAGSSVSPTGAANTGDAGSILRSSISMVFVAIAAVIIA